MAAIWDFEDLDRLYNMFEQAFNLVITEVVDAEDVDEDIARRFNMEKVFIIDDWANDTAEFGSTILETRVFFSVDTVDKESTLPQFDDIARRVSVGMVDVINTGVVNVPENFIGGFTSGVEIKPTAFDAFPEALSLDIQTEKHNMAFDLELQRAIIHREGVSVDKLPTIEVETLREEEVEEEEDEEDGEEEDEEEPEEEEELTEEEKLEERFPDIPEQLRERAREAEGKVVLEVPAGDKDTKTVKPREIYDFEIIQATARRSPVGFRSSELSTGEVMAGIGRARSRDMFGREEADIILGAEPTAIYPRTGVYIRNYLKFRGPSYILQMYNDFLVYLAYANSIHNFNLRVGTYQSFRSYVGALKRAAEEEGNPALINVLNQQEAASRGLQIKPDHPSKEGETADWLEDRKYFQINEEFEDSDIWKDPYGKLYGDGDEE